MGITRKAHSLIHFIGKGQSFITSPLQMSLFYKNEIGRQIFVKHCNIKFRLNQFKGQKDRRKEKHMKKEM